MSRKLDTYQGGICICLSAALAWAHDWTANMTNEGKRLLRAMVAREAEVARVARGIALDEPQTSPWAIVGTALGSILIGTIAWASLELIWQFIAVYLGKD